MRCELVNPSSTITLDPATCDQNLDYIFRIIGNAAPFEGKTATVTAIGPGLQPTYSTTVKGSQMEFKTKSPGSAWSSSPSSGCAGNGTWQMKLATVGSLRAYPDGTLK